MRRPEARGRHLVRLGAAVACLGLAVGCTSSSPVTGSGAASPNGSPAARATAGPSGPAATRSSASLSATGSPQPHDVPPPPKKHGCYRLTLHQLARTSDSSAPVSCDTRHDVQTIFVGRLHDVVDGHAVSVDSDTVRRQLETTCPRKLADFVGGTRSQRRLSRFHVVWFRPTLAQSDRGADWFRCDMVAFATGDTLFPLPARAELHGVLDTRAGRSKYGLCGTAAPGAKDFRRVVCAHRHSWRAIATIDIPGRQYPGEAAVRNAGDSQCKQLVQSRLGFTLKFTYGWEWPTHDQWQRGQHYGFCWAPD
ncbi:MAG TPA: septum formation family protein [Nocardioidaceae bacterium]|nr:septum formation family protein [Nocardioidaceae bacterium]